MSDVSRPGILPCQAIDALIAGGAISAATPFETDQVQPASLDLRLGERALRIRCSFLPGEDTVERKLKDYILDEIDLRGDGAMLEAIGSLQARLENPPASTATIASGGRLRPTIVTASSNGTPSLTLRRRGGAILLSSTTTGPWPSGARNLAMHCFMMRTDWRISSMRMQ